MRLTLDQTVLDKYDVTVGEFMVLYMGAKGIDIQECIRSVMAKGLADKNLFSEGNVVVSDNIKELISTIVIDSDKEVLNKDEEFIELAKELREIYPAGKKEGTTYMWRGTIAEIAKKLKTLVIKYHYSFTKEQVIEATQRYVDSFKYGDRKRMRLLKYFILKSERDADDNVDVVSDLMSLIENEGQEDSKDDWMSTLR